MTAADLRNLLERIRTWPEEAQNELVAVAVQIESELQGNEYRATRDELQVIDRRFTLEPMAMALQRGDEDFRLAIDTALSRLYSSGSYAKTYTTWFGKPSETASLLFQAYALP